MLQIKTTHPFGYRSGEWAQIVETDMVYDRPCWLVSFPDGATDLWVKADPLAGYVIRAVK